MGNNIDIDALVKALEAITEKLTGFVDTTQVTDDELRKRNENLSKSVAKEAGYARDYFHAGPRGHKSFTERIINDFTTTK